MGVDFTAPPAFRCSFFSVSLSSPLVPVSPVLDLLLLRVPIQQQVLCVLSQSCENRDIFCPLVFPLLQNSPSCEGEMEDGVGMSSSSSPSVFSSPWGALCVAPGSGFRTRISPNLVGST